MKPWKHVSIGATIECCDGEDVGGSRRKRTKNKVMETQLIVKKHKDKSNLGETCERVSKDVDDEAR